MNTPSRHCAAAAAIALAMLALGGGLVPGAARAGDLITDADLARLDMRSAWKIDLPLDGGDSLTRAVAVDDNLYLFTSSNRVYAVHVHTGILRWAADIAAPGSQVRGPTHNGEYAAFTTPGAVRLLDRRTGMVATEPRHLSGVIIEIKHDTAEVNLGDVHGLKGGEILDVYFTNEYGEAEGDVVAKFTIGSVKQRYSIGRLTQVNASVKPMAGFKVQADLAMPLESVKLPFAASSPAAANRDHLFVGAANQRFYCVDILRGVTVWELLTPQTVTAAPRLDGKDLLIAGQDGLVICCTQAEKARNWTYTTEGPIFADLVMDARRVYVASSDRSVYCLERATGKRLWRERFDSPLNTSPILSDERLYLEVPDAGLYVLDASDGTQLWRRPQGGRFLLQSGQDAFLLAPERGAPAIARVDVRKGTRKQIAELSVVRLVAASVPAEAILLATADGHVQSLRSRFAPPVRPADVAAVLDDARKMRIAEEVEAGRKPAETAKAEPAKRPTARELMFDDDWLSSRSTARPAGGHGLVGVDDEPREGERRGRAADEDGTEEDTDADTDAEAEDEETGESDDADDMNDDDESDDEADSDDDADSEEEGDSEDEGASDDDDEEEGDSDDEDESEEDDESDDEDDEEEDDDDGG